MRGRESEIFQITAKASLLLKFLVVNTWNWSQGVLDSAQKFHHRKGQLQVYVSLTGLLSLF